MIPKRRIIILGSIVVIAIGASIAAAIIVSQQQNKPSSGGTGDTSKNGGSTPLQEMPAEKTADVADKTAHSGDVQGGVKQLDEAIANTSDKESLYIYYSRKATLLLNNNMLPDALEAAKQAYELHTSSDSAALVGQIAQAQGNKELAIEYYKKAIEHIDKTDPFADEDKTYYQDTIKGLGGTL